MQQNPLRFLSFRLWKQRTARLAEAWFRLPTSSRWRVRRAVMWTMLLASFALALSAAAGIGEARLLADRGVTVATVAAEDDSRWIHANGSIYEARTDGPTVIADPANHHLNATSISEHVRSATIVPALLACLALAVAVGVRGRGATETTVPTVSADVIEFRRVITAGR